MNIARILAIKGNDVHTTTSDQTLQDIAKQMTREKIGALVVLDPHEAIIGIISERDIVVAVARDGVEALQHEVERHMTKSCKFGSEEDSVDETMETMTLERFRHLPILRDGRLVGLVSIGDVVKHRIDAIEAERSALHHYIATA